ncbi:regulator of cell cycle RGCC-like isoform X3 [Parus major]|nr:regulator of cell cycle RGCC-like isoform X3 [Parus major]XP_033370009.1 regulator of cell cycle RGCC-like isoform X3 [Parus major]
MAEELGELLREFEEVMEHFERGPACQYQQHLQELKRKAGQSVYDSGIDELESASTSPGSSLSSSEEHLNTPADTYPTKAKLGDTQELEEFIADLDKALQGALCDGLEAERTWLKIALLPHTDCVRHSSGLCSHPWCPKREM